MAGTINLFQKTIVNNLRRLGYVCRYNMWVPHEKHVMVWNFICDSFLKRNSIETFLKLMVTLKQNIHSQETITCLCQNKTINV